jgi:hypothetical protein
MLRCYFCGSFDFRRSRLRRRDLSHLLFLELPVRCRICSNRRYAGVVKALQVRKADKIRRAQRRPGAADTGNPG